MGRKRILIMKWLRLWLGIVVLVAGGVLHAVETPPEAPAETTLAKSSMTFPEWLYSWNLLLMRIGFYNTRGGLLEFGVCNDLEVPHPYGCFAFYLPESLLQFGVVNRGNGALLRAGVVNYNPYDFRDEPGIEFGLVNKGCYWQIGALGFDTGKGMQSNLVNFGGNVSQLGVVNVRTREINNRHWQCGVINWDNQDSFEFQWGIFNVSTRSEVQIGLINLGTDYGIGLLNFSWKYPYIALPFQRRL